MHHSSGHYSFRLLDRVSVRVVVEKSHAHGRSLTLKLRVCGPVSISEIIEENTQENYKLRRKELVEVYKRTES